MGILVQRSLTCAVAALLLTGCYNFTDETISGTHPVADIRLTRSNGRLFEVWVRVHKDIRLDTLVDISYFNGLNHRMGLDAARQQLGEPRSERMQPDMGLPAYLYPVPKGEIGFISVPTSGGAPPQPQVWAYPTNQSPASVILDASLRTQLLPRLSGEPVRVHVLRAVGFGGITVSMTSNRVDYLILGPRDGE